MRKPKPSRALFGALIFLFAGLTQVHAQLRELLTEPAPGEEAHIKHVVLPTSYRYLFQLGSGLMTSAFNGGQQNFPALQATGLYRLGERVSVGATYALASSTSKAYVDPEGVRSYETSLQQHVGARLSGDIVAQGGFSLYGGLQIGVTSTRQSYRHEFPTSLAYESEADYLATRPSPFYPQASQLGATGFLGVAMRLLPHFHGYLEIGNNLALVSGGLQARF